MTLRARPLEIPVLKMPPELALPAINVLGEFRTYEERKAGLTRLRASVPQRTLINAYVMPSLLALHLFEGKLRGGHLTRFGNAIWKAATEADARELMAQHLVGVDSERVGLVEWLTQNLPNGATKSTVLRRFAQAVAGEDAVQSSAMDRLGKWGSYLVQFGVVNEEAKDGYTSWSVSPRQIAALLNPERHHRLGAKTLGASILDAYAKVSRELSVRLYLPISRFREVLGDLLRDEREALLSDAELNDVIRRIPSILEDYQVTFSPFSGPARGGLKVGGVFAGFISIRKKQTEA